MSKPKQPQHFEFGPFRLDVAERVLLRDGQPVPLAPKAFETLLVLVQHSGHLVGKDALMQALWPDTFVEEGNLSFNVSVLRKALGEAAGGRPYIETVPRRGYRFLAPVTEGGDESVELVIRKRTKARVVKVEREETEPQATGELARDYPDQFAPPAAERPTRRTRQRLVWLMLLIPVASAAVLAYHWAGRKERGPSPPAARTLVTIRSLGVLPFKPLGPETGGEEYLGLGLADTLITRMSNVRQLVVRPTSAVLKFGGPDQDPLAAGRQMEVEAVLDGRVRRQDDRVRVTVQLLRVRDGVLLWAGEFDERFTNILAVQDSISGQVTRALALELNAEERGLLAKHYTENTEAYQAYLKGRYFWNKRSGEGLRRGVEYFTQALDLDPTYALAYAGLADSYALLVWDNELPQEMYIQKAKAAAERALELDEKLAEAHASLGFVKSWYEWDFAGAESEYRRAIELKPNYATGRHWYGEFLVLTGRPDEGFKELKLAQLTDPLSLIINTDIGGMLFFARQQDRAIEQLRKTLEVEPHFPKARLMLAMAYNQKGMSGEAVAELQKIVDIPGGRTLFKAVLGYVYATAGRRDEARAILSELRALAERRHVPPFEMALIYVGLDEREQAFAWLNKAYTERDPFLLYVKTDPHFDRLRTDPRFADLLKRMNLAT